jgi:hypothetical protein
MKILKRTTSLNDTCANCHPPLLLARINKEHDGRREKLMERMRGVGSAAEQMEVQRRVLENERVRRERLAVVGGRNWDGFVDWGVWEGESGMAWVSGDGAE